MDVRWVELGLWLLGRNVPLQSDFTRSTPRRDDGGNDDDNCKKEVDKDDPLVCVMDTFWNDLVMITDDPLCCCCSDVGGVCRLLFVVVVIVNSRGFNSISFISLIAFVRLFVCCVLETQKALCLSNHRYHSFQWQLLLISTIHDLKSVLSNLYSYLKGAVPVEG